MKLAWRRYPSAGYPFFSEAEPPNLLHFLRYRGAADDLVKATDIARNLVTRFGMDVTLEQVSYEVDPEPFLSGAHDRT